METELNNSYWENRYQTGQTGWDLANVSPPLKQYFDQIEDKDLKILIPGAGNAYEAEYLYNMGFNNIHVLDFASSPLKQLKARIPNFPDNHLHCQDFFEHEGKYDYIVEQTFFCALPKALREDYAKKMAELLKPNGVLVGVLFATIFESEKNGPPFGGTKEEYFSYFRPYFNSISMEPCYNSIAPRAGNELFIQLIKE